jgi:uncharacterized RDD family membrane protein YckC
VADAPFDHTEVRLPDGVRLSLPLAGLGSRATALAVDSLLQAAAVGALVALAPAVPVGATPTGLTAAGVGAAVIVLFFVQWGYFCLFEGLWRGLTPGKRLVGIRVIGPTGAGIGMGRAAVRNMVRVADALPAAYLLGAVVAAGSPGRRRLGDWAAGTRVVVDRSRPDRLPRPARRAADPAAEAAMRAVVAARARHLTADDLALLRAALARRRTLSRTAAARIGAALSARLQARLGEDAAPYDPWDLAQAAVEAQRGTHGSEDGPPS